MTARWSNSPEVTQISKVKVQKSLKELREPGKRKKSKTHDSVRFYKLPSDLEVLFSDACFKYVIALVS